MVFSARPVCSCCTIFTFSQLGSNFVRLIQQLKPLRHHFEAPLNITEKLETVFAMALILCPILKTREFHVPTVCRNLLECRAVLQRLVIRLLRLCTRPTCSRHGQLQVPCLMIRVKSSIEIISSHKLIFICNIVKWANVQ